jgi:hypothetical protein
MQVTGLNRLLPSLVAHAGLVLDQRAAWRRHAYLNGATSLSVSLVIYGESAEGGRDLCVSSFGCVLVAEGRLGCGMPQPAHEFGQGGPRVGGENSSGVA